MYQIRRLPKQSKEDFLYKLYNDYGFTELFICKSWISKDIMWFSKWIKYETLMHLNQNDIVPGTLQYKKNFIRDATHRSVLDIELMLDIDDKGEYPSIWKKAIHTFNMIKERNQTLYPVMSFTGSKSYHISIIIPKLRLYTKYTRNMIKETILGFYGADLLKKSDRCMISMESEKHYKSGIRKYEVIA